MNLRTKRLILLTVPVSIPLALLVIQNETDLFSQPDNLEQLIETAVGSTFEIRCEGVDTGSGWAIQLDGESFVVTAAHVVENCSAGEFVGARNVDTGLFSLELVAFDDDYWDTGTTDLALLKSSRELGGLRLQEGAPQPGQWVMTLGYPLVELEGPLVSFSEGRISAIDDYGHGVTSAPINNGNSGGPLINSRGQVVGTIFGSDPPDEYDNLGYAQPLAEHCAMVTACSGSTVLYKLVEPEPR